MISCRQNGELLPFLLNSNKRFSASQVTSGFQRLKRLNQEFLNGVPGTVTLKQLTGHRWGASGRTKSISRRGGIVGFPAQEESVGMYDKDVPCLRGAEIGYI